jgi:transcriptional regulator with PAS, ATPase and Fis domain
MAPDCPELSECLITKLAMRTRSNGQLIGDSGAMRLVREEIGHIAASDAKVLILGETGVGKELVARQVHMNSPRASRPFIAVNCAGLPETLLESVLFGHVKGSFTGAIRDQEGQLEHANRGTIFLDEIGEMTLRMQGLLLRFLETGELQKVGGGAEAIRVDVRVVTATNRDLRAMIQEGTFREDLYYRLNVIQVQVPALRERREDIPALVQYFLAEYAHRNGTQDEKTIVPEALEKMAAYAWPGNVRELQNVIERLLVTARKSTIGVADLPHEILSHHPFGASPHRERRRTPADELFKRMTEHSESFWTAVHPLYMQREITKSHMRELVRKGLTQARGNYKVVASMFNLEPRDYKRFLSFPRKHECQLSYREYRH